MATDNDGVGTRQLVDQNSSLKKEAGIAERKLLARNERIQNLEALLQDADRRLAVQNQKFETQLQAVKDRLEQARCEWSSSIICLWVIVSGLTDDGFCWCWCWCCICVLYGMAHSATDSECVFAQLWPHCETASGWGRSTRHDVIRRIQQCESFGSVARVARGRWGIWCVRGLFTLACIVLHKRVCRLETLIEWLRSGSETCIMVLLLAFANIGARRRFRLRVNGWEGGQPSRRGVLGEGGVVLFYATMTTWSVTIWIYDHIFPPTVYRRDNASRTRRTKQDMGSARLTKAYRVQCALMGGIEQRYVPTRMLLHAGG